MSASPDPGTTQAEEDVPSLGEIGLHQFPPYLMNRIMGRYNADMQQKLSALGLSTSKARALVVLAARSGLMVNELAVYCVIEQSTMSRTLAAMIDEGLVRREEDGQDSRARRMYLTDKGRTLFDAAWPSMSAAADLMLDGIEPGERDRFVTTLQKILGNIRQHPF